MIYLFIFVAKIIENAIGTLRLIVVANGRKVLGAILQCIIALIWVMTASVVIINEDYLKIVFFVLGSGIGSYVGCMIESKLALGSNMLTAIINKDLGDQIINKLRINYAVTVLDGKGKDKYRYILMIMVARKKQHNVVNLIKSIDYDAMIVSENASTIYGGYSR